MVRIVEKIRERQKSGTFFYSFEFFPPRTEAGLENLLQRIDRMTRRLDPLFINVTWSTFKNSSDALHVAGHAQKYLGVDVLLHLSAVNMSRENVETTLKLAKDAGIQNLLVLRGDPPVYKGSWKENSVSGGYFDRAIDLVRFIKEQHGDYFGIAVAGHPEGHSASTSVQDEIRHLKEKVDLGVDFIITQLFYDPNLFVEYVHACRDAGIACPILPGIMPIQSYNSFKRMTDYCKVHVPDHIWKLLEPIKHDDEAVKKVGCDLAIQACNKILNETNESGIHFYTLNLERSVTVVLRQLGAIDIVDPTRGGSDDDEAAISSSPARTETVRSATGRALPWRPSAMEKRSKDELVRPINWANRPKSYVMRTEDWDEFPNGRWGDATSPAFGDLSYTHFYSNSLGSEEEQRSILGKPTVLSDIYEIFAKYVEGQVTSIPWCETHLQPESLLIQSQLANLNRAGFLTINSQPAVNGISSSDKTFGWGSANNGFIYQKAYCECFCSPDNMRHLLNMVKRRESMSMLAVNIAGVETREGMESGDVTALTWGVFPNREILQPTIFDPGTYLVWSEEAFSLWSLWMNLYDFDSPSHELLSEIRDSFFLCAIIDNDFINGTTAKGESIWESMMGAIEGSAEN